MKSLLFKLTFFFLFLFTIGNIDAQKANHEFIDNSQGYDIAVYYFPNYHNDDIRNEKRYGKGWSEWDLVKNAFPVSMNRSNQKFLFGDIPMNLTLR